MEAAAADETQANNMLNSSVANANANAAGEGGTSRCRSHGSVSVEIELVDASTEDDDELLTYPPAFATAAEDYSHRVIYLSRDGKFHRSDSLTQENMDINNIISCRNNNGQGREGSVRADSCSATEGFSTGLVNPQHSPHTMDPPPSPSTAAAERNSSKMNMNMNMMDDSASASSSSSTCSSSGDWEEREQYYDMRLSSSSSYWRQWADGMRPAVWGAALMASALDSLWGLAIGSWLASVSGSGSGSASHSDSGTHTSTTSSSSKMGATEAVLSTFMCGTLFAVLVSNPVFTVRLSVPCVVVLSSVNAAAQKLSLEFVPWMAWIAISTGTLLAFVAITCNTTTNTSTGTGTGTSNLSPASASWPWLPLLAMPQQLGRFCSEIVHAFVGMCLIWHGMQQTVRLINKPDDDYASASASALLSLWFCTCCFLLGLILDLIRLVPLLPFRWRQTAANYGPVFVVVGLVVVSDVTKWSHINVPRLQMAEAGHHSDGSNLGKIVQLQHVPVWAIFLSLVPAAMLTALIILDCCSNWSMIYSKENAKEQMMGWRRRDMLTLAGLLILCGFLGLPPCCGLFSQTKPCKPDLERQAIYSREGRRQEIGAQRVCGFVSSLIVGIPLLPGIVSLLRHIPQPLLWGFCLQMGVHNLAKLWASYHMRKSRFGRASSSSSSSAEGMHTLLQIVSVGVMFSVSRTQAAMLFPLFLFTALWLKQHVMGRAFELKSNSKKQQNHFECKGNTVSPAAGVVACGENESGRVGSESGNHGFGRSRIKWMKRKRKRHSSLDVGPNSSSSMSSSLRFVMKGREIAKRRRNRHAIYIGEEEPVDVHSNCLYDDAESGASCHWLNCMDSSSSAVAEEAISLRPPRLSFEDWAIPAAVDSSISSFHSI